jgi:hypothetical protein
MSTPLRVFIGLSIALHVLLVGMVVVPSILGLFRKPEEPIPDEEILLMKQRAVEKITQEAAREEVRKELAKALKEDIRRAAGDLAPAKFEAFWTNSLAALQTNLDASASELARGNLAELTPADLEMAMRGLRETAIDALMAELGDQTKDEIAAQVLSGVAATLPEFNQKTRELMSQAESPKVRGEVDKIMAGERARRQKELAAATTGLTQAQQQIDQAREQSAAIGQSLASTLGDNRKRADAAARADASVEQALRAAAEAARQAAAMDKAFAAKAAAEAGAAQSEKRMQETAKEQAGVERALAGAQAALREASTQAGAAQTAGVKAGLAAAAAAAKSAGDTVAGVAAALQAKDPAKAATASEAAAAALAETSRGVADLARQLTGAAAGTNAAVASAAAAALKAASSATDLLDKARTGAQAVAAAARQAGAEQQAARRDDVAALAGATEAQGAVRKALEGAARELRGTAAPLTDKAEKPVADALAAAAQKTDAVLNGPVKRTSDLTAARSTAAAQQSLAQTHAAISNLVSDLTRTRGDLLNMTGLPTVDEVKVAGAARAGIEAVSKTLDRAQGQLAKAAAAADKGSETQTSRAIEQTAKDVRETGETTVAQAAEALTPKPADPQIPQSGPRPGRKEISIAQRNMEAATNSLAALSRQVAGEKDRLGGSAQRFESNFARTVDAALTEDPALREQTREFVRQALREKVATEFRARAEDLAGKVLARKGMEKDESFVRRVGQQATDLLLSGSESNLLDNAFAEIMTQTAKQFGVKPDAMRRKLTAEDNEAAGEEIGDDEKGPEGAPQDGASKGKKKKHRKNKGAETSGAQAAATEDDTGMDAVGSALDNSLAKSLKDGTQNALAGSAKTSLRLPGAESFGESQTDSLRQRMAGARGGAVRSLATGGREALIAGMSDNLAKLGLTLKSGASSHRNRGFLENPGEYRKNLEAVIQGREVKEVLLVAPSLTNEVSTATVEIASNRPSLILVGSRRDRTQSPTNALAKAERTLAPPEFKAFAYGGAPFATNPPSIDGDLADWAGVRPFALRGVIETAYWNKPVPAAWETNRYLMVQWDYSGFYFAYQMVDDEDDTNIDRKNFWEGDCLELWFDLSNRRSDSRQADQQQFWFWPLGSRREPGIMGGELIMPGSRPEPFRANNTAPDAPRMVMKRTTYPRGYQVEIHMPAARLRNANLTPGRIIAFDYSTDNGNNAYFWWTTELGKQASMTPSVWGDLVLLGSDAAITTVKPGKTAEPLAAITTVKPGKTAEPLAAIIPGEPLGVRIADADMNIDPRIRNQIKVKFESSTGQALIGYLQETEVSSGVFEGSVDTVEVLADEERDATDNALPVVAGGDVEVSYYDQARRYGERNYTARQRVPVGVPVMRMSAARKGGE